MKQKIYLQVKGFRISVEWHENHVNIKFPETRTTKTSVSRIVSLSMDDVCKAFSRQFTFSQDSNGRTSLLYHQNDGIRFRPGPGKKIEVEEKTYRRVIIRISGHEIRATVPIGKGNRLALLLPKEYAGNDFTFHDLCLAIPKEFGFDRRLNRTRIRCKHHH